MKVIINRCYGGFGLSEEFMKAYPQFEECEYCWHNDKDRRTNKDFISALESFGLEESSGHCASLDIIELPNNTTDWEIDEYDGVESITYVIDGKIKHLY